MDKLLPTKNQHLRAIGKLILGYQLFATMTLRQCAAAIFPKQFLAKSDSDDGVPGTLFPSATLLSVTVALASQSPSARLPVEELLYAVGLTFLRRFQQQECVFTRQLVPTESEWRQECLVTSISF
jgi:hypothetical protein